MKAAEASLPIAFGTIATASGTSSKDCGPHSYCDSTVWPAMARSGRNWAILMGMVSAFTVVLVITAQAAATTITAPYKNERLFPSMSSSAGGANTYVLPALDPTAGSAVYWHNSTGGAGSGQPAGTASFQLIFGFNTTNFTASSTSAQWVNSSWLLIGEVVVGELCINSPGAGSWTAAVVLGENLYDWTTHHWVLATNTSAGVLSKAGSKACPVGGGGSDLSWTGLNATYADSLKVGLTAGNVYSIWAEVESATYADETGTTDGTAISCIDFDLSSSPAQSCSHYVRPGGGEAKLSSVTVLP
jgi:hypothetical protein